MKYADANMCIGAFLNDVHQDLLIKYSARTAESAIDKNDIVQAQELQSFLQELKKRSDIRNQKTAKYTDYADIIIDHAEDLAWEQLFQTLEKVLGSSGLRSMNMLLHRTEGKGTDYFERELGAIITTINNLVLQENGLPQEYAASGFKGTQLGRTRVSMSHGGISDIGDLHLEQWADDVANAVLSDTYTKLINAYNEKLVAKGKTKNLRNTSLNTTFKAKVQGKIDVQGNSKFAEIILNLETSSDMSDFQKRLLSVAKILQEATFTAKNYKGMIWDDATKAYSIPNGNQLLHLGQSDPFRAIHDTLTSIGVESGIAGLYFIKMAEAIDGIKYRSDEYSHEGHDNIVSHIQHLRFVYELTGAGQTYEKTVKLAFPEARFLVYNDPTTGNIYVQSTASIVYNYLTSVLKSNDKYKDVTNDAFFSAMSITKSSVKGI